MKRLITKVLLSTACLLGTTTLSATNNHIFSPDTSIRVKDKVIILQERDKKLNVYVEQVGPDGNVFRARQIFRGVYDLKRSEEQSFVGDKIRLPLFSRYSHNNNDFRGYKRDVGGLGIGFSKYLFDGDLKHLNSSGSYRFTLDLISWRLYRRSHSFHFGTSFDFNKIHFYDDFTLRRDAEGVTREVAPDAGQEFGKNRLSATYFNVYGRFTWRPIPQARNFFLYGYVAGKIRTASSYKAWERKDGRINFDGDRNLNNFIPEIGGGIGYGAFGVQVLHTPKSLFHSGKGPDLRLTTIGVTFGI